MKKWILIPCIVFSLMIFIGMYRFNVIHDDMYGIKNGKNGEREAFQKTIYTSFYPLYFLTKEMVGTGVDVQNIVPNG